ncbi:hypothetical protein KA478_02900 [Patescibacteria group bacterium]|nr:hypothetical protein [Patescibacteria group bacterium]
MRSTGALTSCILLYKRSKRRREKREKREAKAKKDGTYVEKKSFRQT